MYRFSHYLGLAGLIVVALSTDAFSQGNSVGINTATPNPNAVLQLVSPDNNQGLLIPRLTTSQRLAMQLQASEKGLMVFDDTEGLFYYWNGSAWNKLLVSQNLQTLSLDGSLLKVSGANEVDLADIDTDKQNLTFEGTNLSIDRGNTVDLSSLITTSDADPENELQSLEFSGGELKLTNDPTSVVVDLSNYDTDVTDDFDGDYNSLANLPTLFSGDFGDLGNVPADLADGDDVDDADADASNEIQTIIAGTGMTVTPSGINYTVTNAAPDQTVALNNGGSGNLAITGSYPNFTLDVPSVNDADADPNNEDQTVSAGTGISVVQTGDDFQVTNTSPDQTVALNNGGSGFLTITGTYPNFTLDVPSVNDADASTANEIQTITAGTGMTVTPSGINYTVTNAAPDQTVALNNGGSGNLAITGSYPNFTLDVPSVNDADADPNNEDQTVSAGTGISVVQTGDDFQVTNTSPDQTVALNNGGSGFLTITGTYPNFTLDVPSVNDADASTANEIQTITAGTGMTVTPSGINYTVTNAAPDQTVALNNGGSGNLAITGSYPNFTLDVPSVNDADADPNNEDQTVSAGTGISVVQTGDDFQVTNTSPDQTVALNNGGSGFLTITGTYPNFTLDVPSVNDADASTANEIQTITAGTGMTVTPSGINYTVTNAAPDQTVVLADGGAGNVTIGGTYPNLTIDVLSLDDADADPTNEIQDISTDATAGNITLSSGSTLALNVDDADADPTNEIQDISTDATAGNITLSSGSTLALNVDDADADPTNEIQDISTDATAGNITLSSGSTLALNVDDADPDPTNEIQDISTDATAGNITLSSGSTLALNVNDADADPTNEIQDLDLTANTLTITNNGSATNIDLSPYQQDISISGNTLSISGGTGFNLTATSPNPMEVLKWNGTNWDTGTDNVNDGDSNPSNELQTLNLTGTNLTISGFPLSPVDLSPIGVLPDQTGHTGEYLTTNGTGASWNALGALASQNSVTTGFITDGTIAAADLNATVAGNGLSGGAGTPLAVNLSGTSGLQITTDQLEMPTLFPGGTTVGGGATTAINSLTFDAKGRFVSATTIIVLLSDKRLKKEITQLDSSLEKLMQLNGYNYYLKSDSLSKELKTGVIAQEVEKVFPNLILNRPDGFLAVDYQGLIPILLEALKEEHARVSGLENELAQMKVQLSSNDERFKALEAKLDLLIQSTAKATTSSQE